METLEEARTRVHDGREEKHGTVCPCCDQHAQTYRWSLYSSIAKALMMLDHIAAPGEFVHVNVLKERGWRGQGGMAHARWWGLVEEEDKVRSDGGHSGCWRLTQYGKDFIYGRAVIYRYVWVYNRQVLRWSGPPFQDSMQTVTIEDALGKKFNYRAMLAGQF